MSRIKFILGLLSLALLTSCSSPTFYAKTYEFNKTVASGHIEAAEKMLEENQDKLEESKVRFLYFVNAGLVEHLKGDFEKSNSFFLAPRKIMKIRTWFGIREKGSSNDFILLPYKLSAKNKKAKLIIVFTVPR